nr:DMT family transporter [Propionibacterium sp.]
MTSRTAIGVLAAVVTEVLYGCSFVFTKGAVDLITPAALLAWRFVVALAVLGVLVAARVVRLTLTRDSVRPLLLLALFQPLLYYAAETLGVQRTTASESGIIVAIIPVGVLLASWLILGRPPSRGQVVGILVTFGGVVATVVAGGVRTGFDPLGYLLLLAAVASYSLYAVFAERDTATTGIDKTFAMVAVGAAAFSALAVGEAAAGGRLGDLVTLPVTHPELLTSICYLAIGSSVGAFFCQAVAIANLGSNRYSTFIGLSTLAALIAAGVVLGERLAPLQLVGGAVIMLGVYLANATPRTTVEQPQP